VPSQSGDLRARREGLVKRKACMTLCVIVLSCVSGVGCLPANYSAIPLETELAGTIVALNKRSATLAAGETALAEPTPTLPSPTPIHPPTPDPASQAIEQDDLPPGFTPISLGKYRAVLLSASLRGLIILKQFAFVGGVPTQIIVGGTFLIPNEAERRRFDSILETPELLAHALLGGYDHSTLFGITPLSDASLFGYISLGMIANSKLALVQGTVELLAFRRGDIAVVLLTAYPAGARAIVSVEILTDRLDRRLAGGLREPGPAA
jgi:hypothetical protein